MTNSSGDEAEGASEEKKEEEKPKKKKKKTISVEKVSTRVITSHQHSGLTIQIFNID